MVNKGILCKIARDTLIRNFSNLNVLDYWQLRNRSKKAAQNKRGWNPLPGLRFQNIHENLFAAKLHEEGLHKRIKVAVQNRLDIACFVIGAEVLYQFPVLSDGTLKSATYQTLSSSIDS